ncbi:MAG TPA: aminotransferase class V-fold PLP-dependent enzyme [Thermoanaerobaculia bacterium]|nr:aminotransferase class V-fold PLP-dependent enzyme [Thermoanaerobaculia bacterium]
MPLPKEFVDEPLLTLARDRSVAFLRGLPERYVGARASRAEIMAALDVPLSDEGDDPAAVIDSMASQAERAAIASAGPRYFGFVIGGSLPVALAADWLTSAWDQNCGIFATSPLASVAEEVARGWLLDLLGLPATASVGFVTGCQMANFTCLAAARYAALRKAGWNVEEQGLPGAPAVNLVVGAETHVTILTSMRMLGFGTKALIAVPTDGEGRVRADELRRVLDSLDGPTIVCAQAGNVNTGAIDPLRDVIAAAHERDAWLHVDGAFGLWAGASRTKRSLLDGVDGADSWATDAHKWLNVPYDSGLAIVRDPVAHRASMTVSAAYLEQTAGAERDPVDWGPEFSRRGRGFPIYAALRALGRHGVEELVDRGCACARRMAERLIANSRVELLNDVVLNQVLVRFLPPAGGDIDAYTRDVVARVQKDGTCWLAGTTWHEMAAMRISFSSWATTEEDVDRSAAAILGAL